MSAASVHCGAGNLARSRLKAALRATRNARTRQSPAESRLQPGLAAPLYLIQIPRNAIGELGYDWMPMNPAGAPLILARPRCVSVLSKIVVNCEAPVSVSVTVTS